MDVLARRSLDKANLGRGKNITPTAIPTNDHEQFLFDLLKEETERDLLMPVETDIACGAGSKV
jgi:hypothetical protein